jgi:glycosyltransferase involved in cell wall biosynthesis
MPANKPKVSVIIPAYNCETVIGRAISSVLKQNEVELEIIIIDDGSTDNTRYEVTCFENRVRYFFQSNSGPAAARNRGLAESRGEFIAFLDADDEWLPEYLEKTIPLLVRDNKVGLVYSWAIKRNKTGHDKIRNLQSPSRNSWHTLLWPDPLQCTPATICRRTVLEKVGDFDTSLKTREDLDLWIRIGEIAGVAVIPEPLVVVHHSGNSYSSSHDIEQMKTDYFRIITKALERSPELYTKKQRIIMAEAFRYWGQHELYFGYSREARKDLLSSLCVLPSMSALLSLSACLLPSGVLKTLRNFYSRRL